MGRQHDNKANDCLLCWSEPAITTRLVLHIQSLTNQKALAIWADAIFTPDTHQLGMGLLRIIANDLWWFFFPDPSRGITFGVPAAGNTISKHWGMPIRAYLCDDWAAWELGAHQKALWPWTKGIFLLASTWWRGILAWWLLLFSVVEHLSSIVCTCKK